MGGCGRVLWRARDDKVPCRAESPGEILFNDLDKHDGVRHSLPMTFVHSPICFFRF